MKMDDLRAAFESLDFRDVKTYVQSGNVVFRTNGRVSSKLGPTIEDAIERQFGFRSSVLLRTTAEMRDVLARNPFAGRKDIVPGKLLVLFLAGKVPAGAATQLEKLDIAPEELHVGGSEIFIYFPNGQARPRLKWSQFAKIVNLVSTGRNLNTVTKLLEMAEALES